jgi:hypothetical protein
MTTTPTIDGVPGLRSLIERVTSQDLGMSAKKDRAEAAHELRALLNAPAKPAPSCVGELERFESDGEDFVKVGDVIDMLGNLKAAQPQGEPEAIARGLGVLTFMRDEKAHAGCACCPGGDHVFCRYFKGLPDFNDLTQNLRFRSDLEGRQFRVIVELITEQPAPVAPDRPTHANPPPGTEPSGTHPHNDGLDEWRKPMEPDHG